MDAIKEACPAASVSVTCLDQYPVKVSIKDESSGKMLWEGRQQRLFRKNPSDRQNSIEEIKMAVAKAFG